jgi:hypothetical protein
MTPKCDVCQAIDSVQRSTYEAALEHEVFDLTLECCRDRLLLGKKSAEEVSSIYAQWLANGWPVAHKAFEHEMQTIKQARIT